MRKVIYSIVIMIILIVGCKSSQDVDGFWEVDKLTEMRALETCKHWISNNLDLGNNSLDEYHYTVDGFLDDSGNKYLFVQFAHKTEMKELISEYGIEACFGGFPYYFSIDVTSDGKKVLGHYASNK